MNATHLLQMQFKQAHNWINGTVGDIQNDHAHWSPDGILTSVAAQYIHVITLEDVFVNMLQGKSPLMATDFAGKTGISEMPPQGNWGEWGKNVKVDMAALKDYAQNVQANTLSYLDSLSDADLDNPLDLSMIGMGQQILAFGLNLLILNNFAHSGEISAIKGLQGLKGYPA